MWGKEVKDRKQNPGVGKKEAPVCFLSFTISFQCLSTSLFPFFNTLSSFPPLSYLPSLERGGKEDVLKKGNGRLAETRPRKRWPSGQKNPTDDR